MPSYTQFPRSNVPGKTPDTVTPGSFATNWADGKLFVGGPTGVPQLVGFPLRDFRTTSGYRQGDVVVFNNRIWRLNATFAPPGNFNAANWTDLTEGTIADAKELTSSVLLSGGALTVVGGEIRVAAGSGIQMDVANPDNPNPIIFSWPQRSAIGPFMNNAALIVAVTGSGALQLTPFADYLGALQRSTVRIGVVTTDDLGAIVAFYSVPRSGYQSVDTLTDLLRALGPFKRVGLSLSLVGTSGLDVDAGEAFWASSQWEADPSNPNLFSIPAPQALGIRMAFRLGYQIPGIGIAADVSQWDVSGVMQAVPAGRYTNQFAFIDPNGVATCIYGQATYATKVAALDRVALDWQELVIPDVVRGTLLLGCLTSNAEATDQVVTSSNVRVGSPFGGGSGGGSGDLNNYLLIDGTRPMSGSLNLGGNGIIDGTIDGEDVEILPLASITTGEVPSGVDGQLTVNVFDEKIYLGDQLISQRVNVFDEVVAYKVGDLAIQLDILYRCVAPTTPPDAFDPADWVAIGGGGGGGDVSGALIKAPTTATRNEVDLTGGGGSAKALSVTFDANQGADIADFGPRASINRFGVPVGAFGGAVFNVAQATHGFTLIGTPLFFNGLNWVGADATDQARFPNAVIAGIIDANNFTVQVAGRITNLSPLAFEGGVITAGTYYYASDTPGRLTATPGPTLVPVLYTTSTTAGIVKLTGTVIPTVITIADVVDALFPVGSVYLSQDPDNPGTRFPGTTWVPSAQGRALVGVGTADGTSWTVGQQRGNSNVTLTQAQMPAHNHTGSVTSSGTAATAAIRGQFTAIRTSQNGDIIRDASGVFSKATGANSGYTADHNGGDRDRDNVDMNADHSHSVSVSGSFTTSTKGSGSAHNNIQPSIGVYVWLRTA